MQLEVEETGDELEDGEGDREPQRHAQWNHLHPSDYQEPNFELPPLVDGAFERKLRLPILIVVTKVSSQKELEVANALN